MATGNSGEQIQPQRRDLTVREFAEELGFNFEEGEEPTLEGILDPLSGMVRDSDEHLNCPVYCGNCGEIRATELCPGCGGSGANNSLSAASGAYAECEDCGGDRKIHPNCEEELRVAAILEESEELKRLKEISRDGRATRQGASAAAISASIALGMYSEQSWEGPSVKEGDLSPEQVKWLGDWLASEGFVRAS